MGGGAGHHFFTQRGVRAGIAVQFGFHRGQAAVPFGAHLDPDLGGMALGMDDQAFVAVEEQLDRAAGDPGQQRGVDLPGDIFFAAKAAADQLADDMHLLFRHTQHPGHLLAVRIGNLRADVDFHAALRGQAGDAAFRLHKGVVVHGGVEGMLQDDIRGGKTLSISPLRTLMCLSRFPLGWIGRRFGLAGLHRAADHRQRLKFNLDQIQRLGGNLAGFGGHNRQGIAHGAHMLQPIPTITGQSWITRP